MRAVWPNVSQADPFEIALSSSRGGGLGGTMRRISALLLLGFLAVGTTVPARADIERKAIINCGEEQMKICFYIWPALPELLGWHRDEEASYKSRAAFMVPDNDSAANPSPIVFLANAVAADDYKTDHPGRSALDGFIADDNDHTLKDVPGAAITEADPSVAADGVKLRTFILRGLKGGHSQIIAFTEDSDKVGKFFCVLILDSVSKEPVETQMPLFRQMVAKYKHYNG